MGRKSSIRTHDKRAEIETAISSGEPYRNITKRFGLSLRAISQYRKSHMGKAEAQADHAPGLPSDTAVSKLLQSTNGVQRLKLVDELLAAEGFSMSTAEREAKYSPGQGSRVLKSGLVAAALAERLEDQSARTGITITQDEILQRAALIAFTNMADIVSWDERAGSFDLVPSSQLGAKAACISGFAERRGGGLIPKLHPPGPYLALLAKHTGVKRKRRGSFRVVLADPSTGEEETFRMPPVGKKGSES